MFRWDILFEDDNDSKKEKEKRERIKKENAKFIDKELRKSEHVQNLKLLCEGVIAKIAEQNPAKAKRLADGLRNWLRGSIEFNSFISFVTKAATDEGVKGVTKTLTLLRAFNDEVASRKFEKKGEINEYLEDFMETHKKEIQEAVKESIDAIPGIKGMYVKAKRAIVNFFKKIASWFKKMFKSKTVITILILLAAAALGFVIYQKYKANAVKAANESILGLDYDDYDYIFEAEDEEKKDNTVSRKIKKLWETVGGDLVVVGIFITLLLCVAFGASKTIVFVLGGAGLLAMVYLVIKRGSFEMAPASESISEALAEEVNSLFGDAIEEDEDYWF